MKEFVIQRMLRSGPWTLKSLVEKYALRVDDHDPDLVAINYHQIDSRPATCRLVRECRGLVLEKGSWNVVSYALFRFFNYGEHPTITRSIRISDAVILEKIDGSLISCFFYKGKWRMSTRGRIDGDGGLPLGNGTFSDLFWDVVTQRYPNLVKCLDSQYTYYFELTAPENRVVTPYADRALHLLTMRQIETWKEVGRSVVLDAANQMGVRLPGEYTARTAEDVVRMARELKPMEEGYVAVNYSQTDCDGLSYKRVKIKNPAYVAMAHLKESATSSIRGFLQVVIRGEEEEVISYFPEYKPYIDEIKAKWSVFVDSIMSVEKDVAPLLARKSAGDKDVRKDFAQIVTRTPFPAYWFAVYDGKALYFSDFMDKLIERASEKSVASKMVRVLNLKGITLKQRDDG